MTSEVYTLFDENKCVFKMLAFISDFVTIKFCTIKGKSLNKNIILCDTLYSKKKQGALTFTERICQN